MAKPILLHSAAELLERILSEKIPADRQMEGYFRTHKNMGVRDRGFVAETVYGCLREKRWLEHIAGNSLLLDVVAAYLLTHDYSARALEETGFRGDARGMVERARTLDKTTLPFAIQANMPDWLAELLRAQYGDAETLALSQALNQPAPLDMRVNTIKAKRDEVQTRLTQEGFSCEVTPYSPSGLRRRERAPIFKTLCFKEGLFEVQDEGSQLLALMLEPKRQEMVVDFCAGAGGKTLYLGALMANSGTVYAFDVLAKRLDRLKPRLRRAGLNNVRMVTISHERDARVQRLKGKIDRVLVDAPCSGTGTMRRNPDIKWRNINLAELTDTQQRILAAAAELLKPGGRLVYATCSLLKEENDDIVEKFLSEHPDFRMIPVNEILERRHVPLTMEDDVLRLYPHRHHTDGFYAVALERTSG
ncbi:MAG: RsmB/NOP family class I SAM-dependent RNA methyltransferase [Sulfuricaulis sp.]|uniref:RsmB/NOP family class I SAM-dependent RNA methyltransferase n=1 Tax=Sulfuricaulis sp. TaxID=2003553 RepID=UPI0025DD1460|nr:RsmB/NOP family class I SAM-dependent RNA methyltransferase [Sulfuricaulis sp.]MCR4347448.1 RsmB/NOP family class I SAM-dependent RNA methyltransferase [Sulfuricaulis sp.]